MSSKAKHVLSHLIRLINNGIVVFLCPQYDQERKKMEKRSVTEPWRNTALSEVDQHTYVFLFS